MDSNGNIYVAGTTTSTDFPISNALQSKPGPYGTGFIVKLSPDGKSILYSTYFGGLGGPTSINAMTTDPSGNLYLTGTTAASDFPHTAGMPYNTAKYTPDVTGYSFYTAFVAAIAPAGDKLLFSGSVGADGSTCKLNVGCLPAHYTSGIAIALDAAQNIYFGGNASDNNLPTTPGSPVAVGLGAYVGKIAANGTGLEYLTYLSSAYYLLDGYFPNGANVLSSLSVDQAGNAYLAGKTSDPKFPVTPGAYQTTFAGGPIKFVYLAPSTDGFVARLNPRGSALVWATYLGGDGDDAINSIAVDAAGDVWVTGTTTSTNFPNAQGWSQGGDFLVEFNPIGAALLYSARYPNTTISQAVALDPTVFVHTAGASGIVSEIPSTAPPSTKIFAVQNVAGGLLAGRVSPTEIISIYGPHIGTSAMVTLVNGLYPTTVAGVQVTIGGVLAPLLYLSDGQINAVVPMGVQNPATIQLGNSSFPIWIDNADAALFPGVFNQNGSLNSETNPAKLGSVVFFYATGSQSTFSPLTDGQVATKATNSCMPTCPASLGTVVYEGPVPGVVAGVTQFNLLLEPLSVTDLQPVSSYIRGLNMFVTFWVTP